LIQGEKPSKIQASDFRKYSFPTVLPLGNTIHCLYNRSMRPQAINPSNSPKPVGPYSHAVRIGDFLFCSGQIPLLPNGQLIHGGIREQTEQALKNVQAILSDQGLSAVHVVKTTVFLTDLGEFSEMNDVYSNYFSEQYPARSTLQVSALPKGAKVEIEVLACYATP
jgi:2-iminobutanoate/2-iminopropanoate deaminase